jgi:hypothetical protein
LVTSTCSAAQSKPESALGLVRDRGAQLGEPGGGRVVVVAGLRAAAIGRVDDGSGVGKSGSPAPKPITFSPAAFKAFALASTASVADSLMASDASGDASHGQSSRERAPHPGGITTQPGKTAVAPSLLRDVAP